VKVVWFVHAIASCWNNGNAHFLRGIGTELQRRGHDVLFCEPADAWSETNLLRDAGPRALEGFGRAYPGLRRIKYEPERPELEVLTDRADLVIAHEWNEPGIINGLAAIRTRGAQFVLLFHDTHHRALSQLESMRRLNLDGFDGVLAFGAVLAAIYERLGWGKRVKTWHEAADTNIFYPRARQDGHYDFVWIGNWGDDERTAELETFLFEPAEAVALRGTIFGVRYPDTATASLSARGFCYRGWLANHDVPDMFARHKFTVHVPRRPYAETLRGIPTIRVFEALACGIPLLSAPWDDCENLFPAGSFLMARDGTEMRRHMRTVVSDPPLANALMDNGLRAIAERHSCRHRVDELIAIYREIRGSNSMPVGKSEAA
jgi:spore maturation protein CgeB